MSELVNWSVYLSSTHLLSTQTLALDDMNLTGFKETVTVQNVRVKLFFAWTLIC